MISFESVGVVVSRDGNQPDRVLLADISLDLAEHRVCFIGANGSGKSTLLRLINGIRQPTTGRIVVDGVDVATEPRTVRSRVGFIFTDPLAQLLMSTPIEDIELSLRASVRKRGERREHAERLLREQGLGHLAHQSIYDLSGGERQLVALASVLAVDPAIVVADEPTTLLDLRNQLLIRERFANLPQQLIWSTHDMRMAGDADRVIVLDKGRIVADDAPAPAIAAYESSLGISS